MASPDRQLAAGMSKITMPSMSSSLPRTRLFARLDEYESCALIWISAPAGYGKTTAVSGYLSDRRRPVCWYQCDEGDIDIASFFHYVTLAKNELYGHASLPAFLPQYLSAAPAFCRNFFRQWFADVPHGSIFVLDNWQDVPAGAELRKIFPIIAEQLPRGQQIIVISRDEPDSSVCRLMVGERSGHLRVEDLQLSKAETEAIARCHDGSGTSTVDVETLYRKTQGWAAAVTLLLRHGDSSPTSCKDGPLGASQAIFDYLAAEAFERLPPRVHSFLLHLAWLDHIAVPVAERVSGFAEAGSILEALARQNVFTSYRTVSNSYHLHPLFRSFLQSKLQATHSPAARRKLLLKAASALNAEGDVEAALQLLLQARIWNEAAQLIRDVAAKYVDQARLTTLSRWIETLPTDFVAADAWLLYWRGICRFTLNFESARSDLEQAYDKFLLAADSAGQALACAATLQYIAYQ